MRVTLLTVLCLAMSASAETIESPAATPEVRATWLTTTANQAIRTPQDTADTMKRLRAIGLNTVFVECWKNGYTEFPSDVMRRAIGISMKVNPSLRLTPAVERDLLGECVTEAHRNGLLAIAWFEYGFMAAHEGTTNELRARKDWLSRDQTGGEIAKNGFVWLNPLHPDAQQLLIDIVVEAINKYDLDGVQLDDRIVWPGLEMGYDEFTRRAYAAEHDGNEPPLDITDPEWRRWRQEKVEAFATRFVADVREAAGPDFLISLSPGPHPWALENYLIDWPAWSRWGDGAPTWDEYVPQLYRMNYERFAADLAEQVKHIGDRKTDLVAGIRLVGDGPDLPKGDAIKSADACRAAGIGGHAWWFSRGVLDVFPDELRAYYDVATRGPAPHPRRDLRWRHPSIAAERRGDTWVVQRPPADVSAEWVVLIRTGTAWSARERVAGSRRIEVPHRAGVEAVEIIPYRKASPNRRSAR